MGDDWDTEYEYDDSFEYDYSEDLGAQGQGGRGWAQLKVLDLGFNQFTGGVPLTYGFLGEDALPRKSRQHHRHTFLRWKLDITIRQECVPAKGLMYSDVCCWK